MTGLTSSQLADRLGVSRGRVSQYVSEGVLSGCFTGCGRARRFDEEKVRESLQRKLNPGQMMGNGKETRAVLKTLDSDTAQIEVSDFSENHRYEEARTIKAEEEARRLQRVNAEAEGLYVLAEDVARNTQAALRMEITFFETFLKDCARAIAANNGLNAKEVKKHMLDLFREHRKKRSCELKGEAEKASLSSAEEEKNI